MTEQVTLSFNIFDYGRSAEGNFRKYDVDNVRQVLESAKTRERIKLREATGYLGHGRRQIAGKLDLGEVETVQTPSGSIVLENVPACVTTDVAIDDDGTVHHTQDVLSTDPGKVVQALMESKVGGFSWAAGGRDGKRNSATRLNSFHGFDYVMTPGYAKNRSYQILESAGQVEDEREQIFEAMRSCGLDEEKARLYTDTFTSPYLAAADAAEREAEAMETTHILESRLAELEAELEQARQAGDKRKDKLIQWAGDHHVAVPGHVLEAVKEGDFEAERAFFESVARLDRTKVNTLPLGGDLEPPEVKRPRMRRGDTALYGSVDSAPSFD